MGAHDEFDRAAIVAALDCRELADALGWRIRSRLGERWRAHCPNDAAHSNGDRNPSLSIGRESYQCWACNLSGSALDLVAEREDLDINREYLEVLTLAREAAGLAPVQKITGRRRSPRPVASPEDRERARSACLEPPAPRLQLRELDEEAVNLLIALWGIVERAPLGAGALRWLESRGLDVDAAWNAGCRDWRSAREQLRELIEDAHPNALIGAGLANDDEARGLLWCMPLRAAFGQGWGAGEAGEGLALPVSLGGVPLSWRWRLAAPYTIDAATGRTLKTLAMHRPPSLPELARLPLGVWCPDEGAAFEARRAVIIVEGEPDYLSCLSRERELCEELGVEALDVIGVCGVSAFASRAIAGELAAMLEDAARVVVAVHKGPMMGKLGRSVGEQCARRVTRAVVLLEQAKGASLEDAHKRALERVSVRLADDDDDLNDLHRRGALVEHLMRAS